MKPLVIKGLDFMRKQNEEKHQTDVYDPEETRSFMVSGESVYHKTWNRVLSFKLFPMLGCASR